MRVAHHVFQQSVALAHGLFEGQNGLCMCRFKAERCTVQKTSAPFGPFDPEAVHRRHQPEHPPHPSECCLRRRLGVNLELARLSRLGPCFQLVHLVQRLQDTRDLPAQCFGPAGQVVGTRTAQPAAR